MQLGFPGGSVLKNSPAMQEMQVQSLGWEDPLEEGYSYPLQYSCLEYPMDRRAWLAMVHRVAELDTTEATECARKHALYVIITNKVLGVGTKNEGLSWESSS